ncbi:hypothetical protein FSC37_06450 [Piscinibacter aquaticus]|uniref:Uncharacterized protein n=1 Tax=Piscinibacter aquaticus TaxID=392597 RepID=A0A5C6TYQ1_9BURK|nr:hypothetical protein FSC37_06450 [Piscinibacter aquaticus]
MHPTTRTLATAALALAAFAAALPAQAQSFVQTRDWDVYVDVPTRFAYVKTPVKGWVFVRQLDEAQMQNLHPTTLTALLPREADEIHWAHPALEMSPRMLAMRQGTQVAAQPAATRAE